MDGFIIENPDKNGWFGGIRIFRKHNISNTFRYIFAQFENPPAVFVASWSKQPAALHLGEKNHPPFSNIQSPPFSAPLAGNSRQAPDLENNKKNSSHGIYVLVGRFWGWMVISHLKSHRNPGIQQKSMVKVYKHPPKIHGFRKENGMEISPIWKFLFHFRVVFHFSTEPWWEKE